MNKNTKNTTESTEDTEKPEELVSIALIREDLRVRPMELAFIGVESTDGGRTVAKDSAEWGIGDKRGKGLAAGVVVKRQAVADEDGRIIVGILATYRREVDGEEVTREEVFPINWSKEHNKVAHSHKPRTLTTVLGPVSGVRRTILIRPVLVNKKDGSTALHLCLGLPSSEAATVAFDPFED